jgi:hypothetical protein
MVSFQTPMTLEVRVRLAGGCKPGLERFLNKLGTYNMRFEQARSLMYLTFKNSDPMYES